MDKNKYRSIVICVNNGGESFRIPIIDKIKTQFPSVRPNIMHIPLFSEYYLAKLTYLLISNSEEEKKRQDSEYLAERMQEEAEKRAEEEEKRRGEEAGKKKNDCIVF